MKNKFIITIIAIWIITASIVSLIASYNLAAFEAYKINNFSSLAKNSVQNVIINKNINLRRNFYSITKWVKEFLTNKIPWSY